MAKLKTSNFPLDKRSNQLILLVIMLGLVIGGYFVFRSQAAVTGTSIESDSGQITSPAATINDTTASTGKSVGFNAATGGTTVTLAAVGDMATSGSADVTISKRVLDDSSISAVLAAGDIAYNSATESELKTHYVPSWGRLKAKTYPAPGNHEYFISPQPYFDYWNSVGNFANEPKSPTAVIQNTSQSWYAFNLGNWRLYSLNSEQKSISAQWSAQASWLTDDLNKNPKQCILAFWHSPYWAGSGSGVSNGQTKTFMDALYAKGGDLVIAGHEHAYNRFPKMNPSSQQVSNGIRTFVSGMGGTGPTDTGDKSPLNEVYIDRVNDTTIKQGDPVPTTSAAYLKLVLKPTSYDWQYIDTAGTVRDSGSDTCSV